MAAYIAFLCHLQSPRIPFFARATPQSLFCFDNKVDRAFEGTENDAEKSVIFPPFFASALDFLVHWS